MPNMSGSCRVSISVVMSQMPHPGKVQADDDSNYDDAGGAE
jgi:hypothetical protein